MNIEISNRQRIFTAKCFTCNSFCNIPFRPMRGRPIFCKRCMRGYKKIKNGK
jgi:CxxC-x17-CxxC domain-containing protein